jgi:hypothetical protein
VAVAVAVVVVAVRLGGGASPAPPGMHPTHPHLHTRHTATPLATTGTAGRLLDDGHRLLPYNVEPDVGGPKTTMKNLGERLPQTKLRCVAGWRELVVVVLCSPKPRVCPCMTPHSHPPTHTTTPRLSGNANVNQNPMVATMVTIFMREHNRRAMLLESANPRFVCSSTPDDWLCAWGCAPPDSAVSQSLTHAPRDCLSPWLI